MSLLNGGLKKGQDDYQEKKAVALARSSQLKIKKYDFNLVQIF
jgi:hypothetical protein